MEFSYLQQITPMSAGIRIVQLRKNKGMSQELLAEQSGISLRTVQRIESGSVEPRLHTLKTLAGVLDVPIEELTNIYAQSQQDLSRSLKLINVATLSVVLLPVIHILIASAVWRRLAKTSPVDPAASRIISFQILWTITTLALLLIVPIIQKVLIQSYVIGHLPPTVLIVYGTMITVNLIFTLRTSRQLGVGSTEIFSFVPALF